MAPKPKNVKTIFHIFYTIDKYGIDYYIFEQMEITPIKIGIVGTAGRGRDLAKLDRDVYVKAFNHACRTICEISYTEKRPVTLVSGGAAWMDHIAVWLNTKRQWPLELHLPGDFDYERCVFFGSQTARIANFHHVNFSGKTGIDSLRELSISYHAEGVKHFFYGGFKQRNCGIAYASDILLAYTFGDTWPPPGSGTAHTWAVCTGNKLHFSLHNIKYDIQ